MEAGLNQDKLPAGRSQILLGLPPASSDDSLIRESLSSSSSNLDDMEQYFDFSDFDFLVESLQTAKGKEAVDLSQNRDSEFNLQSSMDLEAFGFPSGENTEKIVAVSNENIIT